jgi:DNA-binding NtrC family response regulator
MKPESILVADDEPSICDLLEHWLADTGCTVNRAGSAREAMRCCRQRAFDLVITDVLMPDGDGPDLIAQLKQSHPATRVLAISGGGRYVPAEDCLKIAHGLGAHAVLQKPFDREALFEAIARACAPTGQAGG